MKQKDHNVNLANVWDIFKKVFISNLYSFLDLVITKKYQVLLKEFSRNIKLKKTKTVVSGSNRFLVITTTVTGKEMC